MSHTSIVKRILRWASIALVLAGTGSAYASFWDDVGNVTRVIVAPVTVPLDATKKLLEGDDPAKAVTGPLGSAGSVIQQGSQELQKAQDVFVSLPREAIDRNLGGDWSKAYDILTASQRVQFELATTSGRFLGKCLQGQPCSINELTAAPLAAAMRDAYKAYIFYGRPLDPRMGQILSRVVPGFVLQRTVIAFSATPDFTVPGLLNAGHEVTGHGHAVTLANLVIFSRPLNLQDRGDWNWLIHELRHVEQYASFSFDPLESIDGFAVRYLTDYNGLENDAQSAANQRQAMLDQMCRFGC